MANTKLPARLLDTSAIPALNVTGDLTVDTTTLKVDSTNNRVGVNKASPALALDVVGKLNVLHGASGFRFEEVSNNATIWLDGSNGDFTGSDYWNMTASGTSSLSWGYGTASNLVLSSAGKVGIGRTPAFASLEIQADKTTSNNLQLQLNGATDSNKQMIFGFDTTQNKTFIVNQIAGSAPVPLNIHAAAVGISNSSTFDPKATAHVKAPDNNWESGLLLESPGGVNKGWNFHPETGGELLIGYNAATNATLTNQTAAVSMHLATSGYVGIGTTPAEELHVNSVTSGEHTRVHITKTTTAGTAGLSMRSKDAGNTWTLFQDDNADGNLNIYNSSGGTYTMKLDKNGNVGIGGQAPPSTTNLLVYDPGTATHLHLQHSGTGTGTGDGFQLQSSGTAAYLWNYESGNLQIGTNSTLRQSYLGTAAGGAVSHVHGGVSVGVGNTGAASDTGCKVIGWYNANASNPSYSYLHLVTTLWGGGSPSGNSQYIMGGWEITGHQYATNASHGKCNVFFHNWSGNVASGYSLSYTGAYTGWCLVYVNSSGYVTIRLNSGNYKGYWLDLFQAGHYPMRTINVSAATFSNSTTL